MKFLADESFDFPFIAAMRNSGYDVTAIVESTSGIEDEEVLKISNTENRILLTCDKDFGELVFRLKLFHSGIILLRLPDVSEEQKTSLLLSSVKIYSDKLASSFTVITSSKIRIISFAT